MKNPLPARPATLALVEMVADRDTDTRSRLLAAAYTASRSGIVLLLLRDIERAAIDRLLDPVVRRTGVDVYGVRYLEANDEAAVDEALRSAPMVVAATTAFRCAVERGGRTALSIEEALDRWCAEPEDPDGPARATVRTGTSMLNGGPRRTHDEQAVMMLVVAGPPCSGKSTLARAIAHKRSLVHLEMDRVRARLLPDEGNAKRARSVAYHAMHASAESLLEVGQSVVLDATYGPAPQRAAVEAIATRTGATLLLVQCRVPPAVAAARYAARDRGHPADDLTGERVTRLALEYPFFDDALAIDMTCDLAMALRAVERYMEQRVSLSPAAGWSAAAVGCWT